MVLPSPKLLVVLLIPAVIVAVFPSRAMITAMLGYDAAVLLLLLIDLAYSTRPAQVRLTRRLPTHLLLGADNRIIWEIENTAAWDLALRVADTVPESFDADGLPMHLKIRGRSRAQVHYSVRPTRRGLYELGDVWLRYSTRLGLAIRQQRRSTKASAKVYPGVLGLGRHRLALSARRLMQMGLIGSRQRGRGGEFESLRDYVPGDDLADVSWKSTARRGRLTTRAYQAERSQNVMLVVDCGRLMTPEVDGMSRLDYAVNAALLLTYVAVKQGDYVGMVGFSDRIESYMPLTKGRGALMRMNEALYRLEPRLREPDYERVCRFLGLRQRKRSLIVIFTDVIDTEASATLLAYTARFARYHLPLCVTMRDLEVESIARAPGGTGGDGDTGGTGGTGGAGDPSDCFRQSVALQMLHRRALALQRMRRSGVDVLDAHPLTLTPNLLERYLALKQRHRL